MPRVKNSVATRARRKKVLNRAKGYVGGRRTLYKNAQETVDRALRFSFRDRKQKKRHFRELWNVRLSAALAPFELSYSRFINLLKCAKIELNRKVLSNLAIEDPATFAKVVETAKKAA